MKKLILSLAITLVANLSTAATLSCQYSEKLNGSEHALVSTVNVDTYEVQMSQLTPHGVRQQTYKDAVILCDDNKSVLVFVETETEKFNFTIKADGIGELKFEKDLNGPSTKQLQCEKFDAAAICG